MPSARERGAEAIGLVRTEFIQLYNDRRPYADFYACEFDNLLAAAQPLKVTLRLLDIAVDEQPAWLPAGKAFGGALGRQGVRLFEDEPVRSVVDAQLAALAGCDAYGRLRLLIPYITNVAEAAHWHARIRARLDVSVGMMIETPAANAVCIPYPAVTVQAIQVVADRALAQSVCRAKSSLDVREMLGVDEDSAGESPAHRAGHETDTPLALIAQ